jgi:hypothetical protein
VTIVDWLLDSDPSIRWQVLRDIVRAPHEQVVAERARVATEGWGARLLGLQAPDGHWGGATFTRGWTSTFYSLVLLRDLGIEPSSEPARRALRLVDARVDWGEEFGRSRFFEGEVEPCINGRVLALGAYFGEPSAALLDRLLGAQLEDGGWNCKAPPSTRSSFHTTICVLEGLHAFECAFGAIPAVTSARLRAHEYLLERRLLRSLSTGAVLSPDWQVFSYPFYWHYDLLRGLDYLRAADIARDERAAEAIARVEGKRRADGKWLAESPHPGAVHFAMECAEGEASRWNTLRAMRVLAWWQG